jgi:hypothetical protein
MRNLFICCSFFAGVFIGAVSLLIATKKNETISNSKFIEVREEVNLDNYTLMLSPNASELSMVAKCSTDALNDKSFVDSVGLIDPRDVTLYRKNDSKDYVVSFKLWQSLDIYVAYFIISGEIYPRFKGIYSLA